ncbi:hypothetical protein HPB51_024965 [Rhipicephalus microplus]|uniref:Uncharacterized protein n=1 Tax=Rhipicephalus microplus TaxID=6941 RepID=A0A9J6D7V1_RHIMP|nr:hypothetical protein HPB51_024965 [Rhipicephalus microplus]
MTRQQTCARKVAKETFPFVAPDEQVFGQAARYHYVPLPKLLHVLCNIPDIGDHLKTPEPDNQTWSVYRDYTDYMLYREHLRSVIPQGCAYTVIIFFYTEELEMVNPLGAKRGTHKLLVVYCCLLNLHARYRSTLQSIFLVMLVRYAYVKTYGLTPVCQPLLTDLNHLFDEGLTIDLEGITTSVGVLLFGFSGDNLSMHLLGGFTRSFSNGPVCRFCMVSTKQLSLQTSERLCKVRTTDRHKLHLQAISVNGAANKRLHDTDKLKMGAAALACSHARCASRYEYALRRLLQPCSRGSWCFVLEATVHLNRKCDRLLLSEKTKRNKMADLFENGGATREVVVDFAAGWNKHIVNTSSAICKPVRSSDKGLCMHQRAAVVVWWLRLSCGSAGQIIESLLRWLNFRSGENAVGSDGYRSTATHVPNFAGATPVCCGPSPTQPKNKNTAATRVSSYDCTWLLWKVLVPVQESTYFPVMDFVHDSCARFHRPIQRTFSR